MKARLGVALTVLLGVTAFAPAPLPRRARSAGNAIDLSRLEGRWKVVSMWRYGQNAQIAYRIDVWNEICIEHGECAFCRVTNGVITPSTTYRLAVDGGKTPATIDFKRPNEEKAWMMGIVRFRDDKLEVLY